MKNFERININSDKLLKNEELKTLRGGQALDDSTTFGCKTSNPNVVLGCKTLTTCDVEAAILWCEKLGGDTLVHTCGISWDCDV
jgi:hypothetical protein